EDMDEEAMGEIVPCPSYGHVTKAAVTSLAKSQTALKHRYRYVLAHPE
ncbi:MAG: hypothetical protein RJB54_153, partial [Actinomycetota bacterium]